MSIHSRKGAESGQRRTPCKSLYKIRLFLGCGAQKRTGRNWLYRSQFRLHLSRKIIRILRRIATVPVLFLCHSLRTAHRIQKTFRAFLSAGPRPLFCVRLSTNKSSDILPAFERYRHSTTLALASRRLTFSIKSLIPQPPDTL